jgi:hypothetical protein
VLLYLPRVESELDRTPERDSLHKDRYAAVAKAAEDLLKMDDAPSSDAIKAYLDAALLHLRDYRMVPAARDLASTFPECTLRAIMTAYPITAPLAMAVLALGRPAAAHQGPWPYLGHVDGVTRNSRGVATMAVLLVCALAQPTRRGADGAETLPALFIAMLKEMGVTNLPLRLGGDVRAVLSKFPAAATRLSDEGVEPPGSWQRDLFTDTAKILDPALRAELEYLLEKRVHTMHWDDMDFAHVVYVLQRYPGWKPANLFMDAHLDDWLVLLLWVLGAPPNARSHADIAAFYTKFPLETGHKSLSGGTDTAVLDSGVKCDWCTSPKHTEESCPRKGKGMEPGPGSSAATSNKTATGGGESGGVAPCAHCGKSGHTEATCRRKLGLCLQCGGAGHYSKDCTHAKTRAAVVAETASAEGVGASPPDPAAFFQQLAQWMTANQTASRHVKIAEDPWLTAAGEDLGSALGPSHLASPHAYSRATTLVPLDLPNKKEREEQWGDVAWDEDPGKFVPYVPAERIMITMGQPAVGFVNGRHREQAAPRACFYADSGGPTLREAGAFVNEDWVPNLPRKEFDTPITVEGAGIDGQATHYVDLELVVRASRACVTTEEGLDPPTSFEFKVKAIVVPASRWQTSAFHTVGGVNVSIVLNPGALRDGEPALNELWKLLHEAQAGKPLFTHAAPTTVLEVVEGKGSLGVATSFLEDPPPLFEIGHSAPIGVTRAYPSSGGMVTGSYLDDVVLQEYGEKNHLTVKGGAPKRI